MKRRLYLILLLAAVTLSGMAQTIGEAFYIYRNDGEFNAFFRDEVISIDYSYEDADGNTYDEIVTQIVNTVDSVYKIPLAAIDSVSFVQPETILQPNVLLMDKNSMMDYLKSVDGMSLTFDRSMPQSIHPHIGDILVCSDFNNPLFKEGFVGKVSAVNTLTEGLVAICDSVYDITEIYKQLISIEQIVDDRTANVPRRAEWISSRNHLDLNLGYSHDISNGKASLSGSVNGSYITTIVYNITANEQYMNLRISHDWQYSAHLNFKCDKGFGFIGNVMDLLTIRFPMPVPIFQFQISGAPFMKGDGSMDLDFSLNSPVHSYLTEVTFRNGVFTGTNRGRPVSGSNKPSFDVAFSLNGGLQGGYMVDFWLGTIDALGCYLRTGLDFYIGPKLTGNFSMSWSTSNPLNYYNTYKDSKLGISLLTIDYEAFGEASFMGFKTPRGLFMNGSLQTPLYHEWYILPDFCNLTIDKDERKQSATISCTPTKDILFPLVLGIGLYDEDGELKELAFETDKYKRENEGYIIQQTFYSLERDKEYEARPMIKILGGEVPATPTETFSMEYDFPVKLSGFKQVNSRYKENGYSYDYNNYSYRFQCALTAELTDNENVVDWGFVYETPEGMEGYVSLSQYSSPCNDINWLCYTNNPNTTVTVYGYVKYRSDSEYYYGEEETYQLTYEDEEFPVKITDFKQTGSDYSEQGFSYEGRSYTYKYDCSVTVELSDSKDVEDWGYVYEDPDGNVKTISLRGFTSPYTDERYIYYRNDSESTVCLYEYVKYDDDETYYYGKPHDYPVKYEDKLSVVTLGADVKETNAAIVRGRVENYIAGVDDGEVGFFYNTTGHPQQSNAEYVSAGMLSQHFGGEFDAELSGLEADKTYYYCAYLYIDGEYRYGEIQSFETKKGETSCPDGNHPHWIDLGLGSGTKWACCNVGASTPEGFGGYYTFDQAQAYNPPSDGQIEELINNTTYVWTTQNGVNGGKFTGRNGGTIFLPAAGHRWSGGLYYVGSYGNYWSSTPYDELFVFGLGFNSGRAYWGTYGDFRFYELSVRSVR